MSADNLDIVQKISPVFRPYVQNIYRELKLGLCKSKVEIERISCVSDVEDSQFRLVLPYCSKKLKWEVIFDPMTPWFAPDFRFDDDTFLMTTDEDLLENSIPSLSKWNETDPKALSQVIEELVTLYKSHQINKLNEDESSRAYFEYSALLGDALTLEHDIEVFVSDHVVEFLIKLNVDVSALPEIYNDGSEDNPGLDTALLLVKYPNSNNAAELILSPLLTKSLGTITLPLMHQSGVLMDYVPMVTNLLNNKIKDVVNNVKVKRELLAKLIVKYEGAVLEYDTSSATFLFQMNDFYWILQIDIDMQAPEKLPVLTLRSVYHSNKRKPKCKILSSCRINNFESFIEQQVEIFKNECKSGTHNNQLVDLEN